MNLNWIANLISAIEEKLAEDPELKYGEVASILETVGLVLQYLGYLHRLESAQEATRQRLEEALPGLAELFYINNDDNISSLIYTWARMIDEDIDRPDSTGSTAILQKLLHAYYEVEKCEKKVQGRDQGLTSHEKEGEKDKSDIEDEMCGLGALFSESEG